MVSLVAPFAAIGVYYFPSDPERWLFLLPVVWLLIGLVWDRYLPSSRSLLTPSRSVALLLVLVGTIGCYNTFAKILPEAKHDRDLSGLQQLDAVASDQDLVISPSGITARVDELSWETGHTSKISHCRDWSRSTGPEERSYKSPCAVKSTDDCRRKVMRIDLSVKAL